jgi:ABC-type phosphate transport system permease subunit
VHGVAAQSSPIIVKLIEPPHDPTGIAGAILGAIGLTAAITLAAVTLGLIAGALIFWLRSRQA